MILGIAGQKLVAKRTHYWARNCTHEPALFYPDVHDLGLLGLVGLDEDFELLAAPAEAAGLVRGAFGFR